jgi:hypothetical protein
MGAPRLRVRGPKMTGDSDFLYAAPKRFACAAFSKVFAILKSKSVARLGKTSKHIVFAHPAFAWGRGAQQVPPLRYAPVGMTKGRAALTSAAVMRDGQSGRSLSAILITLGWHKAQVSFCPSDLTAS